MLRICCASLAALALLVAGCGGEDDDAGAAKEAYLEQAAAVAHALDEAAVVFAEDFASVDPGELAGKLAEGADLIAKAAGDLGEVEPPSDIEDAHARMVAGLEALADEFRAAAAAAEEGDSETLAAIGEELQSSQALEEVSAAGEEIEEAGYEFMPVVE